MFGSVQRCPQSIVAAAIAVASLGTLAAAPASAASARTVVGSVARLPEHAQVLGALSATHRLALTVSLEPRDPAALARYATAVSTPGDSDYGSFLTVRRFAARFGAPRSHVAAVMRTLRRDGLTIGRLDRNDLTLAVSGSTSTVEHAFGESEFAVRADGRSAFANSSKATLPAAIAGYVQAVNGFDDVTLDNAIKPLVSHRDSAPAPLARRANAVPHVPTNGGPQPCSAATTEATQGGVGAGVTADEVATAYGFPALYQSGDFGQGQTIGLFEISQDIPTDPATYFACYGIAPTVTVVPVNGGPPVSGDDGEVALDIEVVAGLAPKAAIDVYQGSGALSAAPALYSSAISADQAKILSASLGACEPNDPTSISSAENTLFQEAAAQGQTMLASSGDQGSSACDTAQGASTALAVDDPASQPFVTGVGGTSLFSAQGQQAVPYTGTLPPIQGVWNDGDNGQVSGTGGGVSTRSAMPTYQSTAAGSLAVIGPNSSGAPCGAASGDCREVPDVSANADPQTGYVVFATTGGNPAEWTQIGGTSAASPVWAAFMAETNDLPACRGLTIGFANPLLYAVASAAYNTNFSDISIAGIAQAANNDAAGVNNGLYPVGAGYDMATGLGSMTSTLASSLCATRSPVYTVAVASPGAVTGTVGTAFALAVHGSDSGGAALTYAASGLPAGLAINPATGIISGTPTTAQATTVTVSATDGYTNAGSVQFAATIANAKVVRPTLAKVGSLKLAGLVTRRPTLAFALSAGSGAPALKSFSVTLPTGLSFATKTKTLDKGIAIKVGRKALKYKATVKQGVLTIVLSKKERSVTVTLGRPVLKISSSEALKIKHKKVKKLVLAFRVVNASKAKKTLKVTVKKLA